MDFFQTIIGNSPTVRKLSLKRFCVEKSTLPPIEILAEELVSKLVKFEEVYFGICSFLVRNDVGIADAILRRLTAVISSGEESKLKVFSMPGFERDISVSVLREARKILTVNILKRQLRIQKSS